MSEKTRIDKWIWSVRIFKSRTIATDACKASKIKINGNNSKPSSLVSEGDLISVKKNGFDFSFKVLKIISKRVSATIAVTCYEDCTPESELNKFKDWYVGKSLGEQRSKGVGRPTKKDRRSLDDFKTIDQFLEIEE